MIEVANKQPRMLRSLPYRVEHKLYIHVYTWLSLYLLASLTSLSPNSGAAVAAEALATTCFRLDRYSIRAKVKRSGPRRINTAELVNPLNRARMVELAPAGIGSVCNNRVYTKRMGSGLLNFLLDNNTSDAETIFTMNISRQRKAHRKSHEGCEQCKERHVKVRRQRRRLIPLSPVGMAIALHSISWLSHMSLV